MPGELRVRARIILYVVTGLALLPSDPIYGGPPDPVAALVAAPSEAPPDTLRGQVTEPDGTPIEGVEVRVAELGRTVDSDAEGRFAFDLTPGWYTLTFQRTGYQSRVRRVEVRGPTTISVQLAITPFRVRGIDVTVTGAPLETDLTPQSTTIMSRAELDRHSTVSLAYTIEGLPSVNNLSTGGQIGKPVIRGLSESRVSVLVDGLPLQYDSWSDEDAPPIDARLADRVEIVRGPASVLYGGDALGGVVNVLPPAIPQAPRGASLFNGEFEIYGGTNNRELGSVLGLSGAGGKFGWLVKAIGRNGEDLHTPDGELENTGFKALNGEAAVGVHGDWGGLTLRYHRYGGEFLLLEAGDTLAPEEAGGPERKISDDWVEFGASYPLAGMRMETRAAWERHWTQEAAEGETVGGGAPAEESEFELLSNTVSFRTLAHHHLSDRVRGAVGISALFQASESEGELPVVPNTRTLSGGLFALEDFSLGRVRLFAGARFDGQRLEADANAELGVSAQTLDWTALTGSLGFSLAASSDLTLTGNVGRAWRAPNPFELFADGPRIGEARYEIGSPDLTTETSLGAELGLLWQPARWRAEVRGFDTRIGNYIFLAPTGEMQAGLPLYRYEQADANLVGAELSAQVEALDFLGLGGRFDVVRGTNTETDEPLPQIPPRRGDLEVELHTVENASAGRAFVRADLELVGTQTRLSDFDYPTDGYTLLNFAAGYERQVGRWPLRVDLTVHNATDVSYRGFLSRYKRFALNPGRDIVLRLGTRF